MCGGGGRGGDGAYGKGTGLMCLVIVSYQTGIVPAAAVAACLPDEEADGAHMLAGRPTSRLLSSTGAPPCLALAGMAADRGHRDSVRALRIGRPGARPNRSICEQQGGEQEC